MELVVNYLYEYYWTTTLGQLELVASLVTLLCVWMVSRQNIWNFPVGILGVLLYGYIFYEVKLYADVILQWGYFLPISFYGWWYWYTKGPQIDSLQPSWVSYWGISKVETWFDHCVIIAWAAFIIGYLLKSFTDAALPYADSFILSGSVYAQFLLSRKKIDNWIIWIMVDVVAIVVYSMKGLYVTSGLYFILLLICINGLYSWTRPREIIYGRTV